MKRYLLSAILLLAIFIDGFAQNNVMYVYRNDGVINSFLKEEIDSIRWSCLGIDSVAHNDYVCQEVWTADSIYRIPLELVDSVSFVTPKTVLSVGVVDIDKSMWEYVLRSEEQIFILSSSIPSGLIPTVGTKLVYMKMDEKFPGGFAGEVSAVNSTAEGFSVVCNDVKLEDVFDTFYSTTSVYGYAQEEKNNAKSIFDGVEEYGDTIFRLPIIRFSQSGEISRNVLSRDLAIKGGTKYELSISPQFHVRTSLIINKEMGVYHSASIYGDITIQQQFSLYGGLEYKTDFLDPEIALIPVAPFTYFYLKPGLFVNAEVDATLSATLTHRYTTAMAYDYSSKGKNLLKPTCGGRLADSSLEVEGSIDGKIALGGFMEAGVTFVKSDLDKISARCELGGELVGHAVLYNSEIDALDKEAKTYEKFKKSKFELNAFVHSFAEAKVGLWGIKKSLPWDLNYNIRTWDVVPTFSHVTLKKNSEYPTNVDAYAEMSGDCLIPVGVGFSLFDSKKNLLDTYSSDTKFDNGYKYMNYTFSSTQSGNKYIVYPTVDFLGFKMLANPKAEIELDEHRSKVHITNFEQTGSSYLKRGYTNDYRTYDYKYDVATTVTVDDDVDISIVEDWGYVYKDPYGQSKRISLKSNSSPHTDTRYAYYRNDYSSSVVLYGYIKYLGDYNYYYDEPKEFKLKYEENLPIRDYLISIYQTTNGDNWKRNDNWCTNAPVITWYGIYENNGIYKINLHYNNLTGYINISGCTAPYSLDCSSNRLTSIDVSGCTELSKLDCECNELTVLRISDCTVLSDINCSDNKLSDLDFSECKSLRYLACGSDKLTSLNVSGCTKLVSIADFLYEPLASLNISGCTALESLGCIGCKLTSLDASSCKALRGLVCDECSLTSLNVSGCKELRSLSCIGNQLTTLNVSGCTSLELLWCYENQLTELNVSGFTALYDLQCQYNQIEDLNISGCTTLDGIYEGGNNYKKINASGCTAITDLNVRGYQLVSLDVTGCTALKKLDCSDNQLTSLDVSSCTALEELYCHYNQLTTLDVSSCAKLEKIWCVSNKLNSIIDGIFANIYNFYYDQKYYYNNIYDANGKIKEVRYTINPYGWWYPGEPQKGYHGPN